MSVRIWPRSRGWRTQPLQVRGRSSDRVNQGTPQEALNRTCGQQKETNADRGDPARRCRLGYSGDRQHQMERMEGEGVDHASYREHHRVPESVQPIVLARERQPVQQRGNRRVGQREA